MEIKYMISIYSCLHFCISLHRVSHSDNIKCVYIYYLSFSKASLTHKIENNVISNLSTVLSTLTALIVRFLVP